MDVDTPALSDISGLVAKARDELAGVMTALTEVLVAVAVSYETLKHHRIHLTSKKSVNATKVKVESNGPSAAQANPAQPPPPKPSIDPVLTKFHELRKSVEHAVSMHSRFVSNGKKGEDSVSQDDRAALTERRATLIAEVQNKNEKVKLLIDQLRDLHRDIVMLLSGYYKPLTFRGLRDDRDDQGTSFQCISTQPAKEIGSSAIHFCQPLLKLNGHKINAAPPDVPLRGVLLASDGIKGFSHGSFGSDQTADL